MLNPILIASALCVLLNACGGNSGMVSGQSVPASPTVAAYKPGDKVVYNEQMALHLEPFLAPNLPVTRAMLEGRDNPVMQKKKEIRARDGKASTYKEDYPEARAYDVFDAIVVPQFKHLGVHFLPGGRNGCVFDVILHDVNPAAFGPVMVLDKHDRFTGGMLTPHPHSSRSVRYENLKIMEAAPIVLPKGRGVYGENPAAEFVVKAGSTCRIKNPGSDGKHLMVSMRHRLDNKGQLVAILIDESASLASQ